MVTHNLRENIDEIIKFTKMTELRNLVSFLCEIEFKCENLRKVADI